MPALAHPADLADPFCLRSSGIVTWLGFLEDVGRVARAIEGSDVVCNLAVGRYDFCVLLVAAMLNGQPSVLPPARAERAVEAALRGWQRPLVAGKLDALLGHVPRETPDELLARLPQAGGKVYVFTSGSTGEPVRHEKTWTSLSGGGWLTDRLIADAGLDRRSATIVGTTPSQHMYGLEAAVFAGLAFGHCLCDLPVFHPGDLDTVSETMRRHRPGAMVLVTSPPHLRFLEEAVLEHPEIRCLISATAPLHQDVARRIEAGGHCRVAEIYGSTETGSMASRRTAETPVWTPAHGFTLQQGADGWLANAPHLASPVTIADDVAQHDDGGFELIGRRGDMVLIAGKRHSLGALNAVLAAMPGPRDGVIVRRTVDGEDRLTLLVVADPQSGGRDELIARVRRHMLDHVDPVFVPRRIRVVASLPRGETGKIPARELERLTEEET